MEDIPELTQVIDVLSVNHKLVFWFFAFFSRFEYALKRTCFLKSGAKSKAQPNWDTFADSLCGKFESVQNKAFQEAMVFLCQKPPRQQVVSGCDLEWCETEQGDGESLEKYVLRLVRTVRNNLFHGGKYPSGPMYDMARDGKLLKESIVVLRQCLELSDSVRKAFEETP